MILNKKLGVENKPTNILHPSCKKMHKLKICKDVKEICNIILST